MTVSQSTNTVKSEPNQIISNGPLVSPSTGGHVSVPSNGQMVQRVQTIQLPAQKQQLLKNIQLQIQAMQSRKASGQCDQALLTKLYEEQAKIIASGKVVSTTTHSVNRVSIAACIKFTTFFFCSQVYEHAKLTRLQASVRELRIQRFESFESQIFK